MSDFDSLVGAISRGQASPDLLPAVSFLKAPAYQDGHAAYSDPLDEQKFIASEINALQQTPDWASTAVVIAYDDSDGFYDHAYSGVRNPSNTSAAATPPGPQDFLSGAGMCASTTTATPLAGQNGRCGYGPRMPLMVISPWAKANYVDHTLTDLSSIPKFIEDNWQLPRINGSFDAIAGPIDPMFDFSQAQGNNATLFLDPNTGQPTQTVPVGSPATGVGGASHSTDQALLALGGLALLGAGGAISHAIRGRRVTAHPGTGGRSGGNG